MFGDLEKFDDPREARPAGERWSDVCKRHFE
jgi:hypothetical protein